MGERARYERVRVRAGCSHHHIGAGLVGRFELYQAQTSDRRYAHCARALVRSAPQGYIELQGSAELMDGDPLYAPLFGRLCTWYQFRVERRETHYDNGKRRSSWATLEQGTSDDLFYLADITGSCAIDPEGATVTPTHRNIWSGRSQTPSRYDAADASWWAPGMGRMGGQYRYTERRIDAGHAIYAIGDFITHGGAASRADSGAQTAVLLRQWKRDQTPCLPDSIPMATVKSTCRSGNRRAWRLRARWPRRNQAPLRRHRWTCLRRRATDSVPSSSPPLPKIKSSPDPTAGRRRF